MRLGLIGCGRHGSRYASHLLSKEVPGTRLVAICRRDAAAGRRFAATNGLAYHSEPEALIGDARVEGVVICTPPDLHPRIAGSALAAGRAVLVEKPLAATVGGARRIEKAASGKTLMVAQTLRFNSVVRGIAARLPDLGPLHAFSASQRHEPVALDWLDDPDRGGTLRVTGVHAFDLACHLTGAWPSTAWCETLSPAPGRADQAFAAVLRLEPGALLATVENSWLSDGRTGRLELVGARGSLVGDHVTGELSFVSPAGTRLLPVDPPVPTVRECLRAFVAASRGEIAVPVPASDGRRAVEIVEACRQSSRSGRPVRIGEES